MANEATLSPLPIAHLGPEGTFSEEAVLKLFPSEEPRLPCATFDAVLESVETGRAQGGRHCHWKQYKWHSYPCNGSSAQHLTNNCGRSNGTHYS